MQPFITNPILKGFNPDPSIVCVKDVFYIATSTFEWFPGVQIHQSRDLINWQLMGQVLDRQSQLDMKGTPDSCGVWAPCLSYNKGIFYLVYSNVRSFDGPWKDTPNYLVTSNAIEGPWSQPVYLHSSGFDVSLFHDINGQKWLVNMIVDHRQGKLFGGIQLQAWDEETQKLIGKSYKIFEGTELGCTEGPHIYQRNGWYYLLTAEGGTDYRHSVTIARAKNIIGPYELHPENPIITASQQSHAHFQRTGHADFIETQQGDWYAVYLGSRPLMPLQRCTLGRETLIEQIYWKNDWPYLATPDKTTRIHVPAPACVSFPFAPKEHIDHFNSPRLSPDWQSLRIPVDESWLSLAARPGHLRLYGRESLSSIHSQSLVARRLQSFNIEVACQLEFKPESFQQMAGLVCYYNTAHYFYFYVSVDDANASLNQLKIIVVNNNYTTEPVIEKISFSPVDPIYLKVKWIRDRLQFFYSHSNKPDSWTSFGPLLDASILSDDYVRDGGHQYRAAFTGAFIGLNCQDLSGDKIIADFDWFSYEEYEQD
ncbi:MAG: glycoside hydrolase family 43 protein [Pseudomonadota bacterium]